MCQSIRVTFCSHPARAMRRGVGCPIPPVVTLDIAPAKLSQVDRDRLAARLNEAGDVVHLDEEGYSHGRHKRVRGMLSHDETPQLVLSDTPLLADLMEAIRAEDEAIATYAGRCDAQRQEEADERRRQSLERLHVPHTGEKRVYVSLLDTGHIRVHDYIPGDAIATECNSYHAEWSQHLPDALVRASDAARANEERWAVETEQRKQSAIAEATARLNVVTAERHQWIAQHGSRRLQRMVSEGIAHQRTYERERAAYDAAQFQVAIDAERPGWSPINDTDWVESVADVSHRSLALLDAARAIAPAAKLARLRTGKIVVVEEFRGRMIFWPRD